MIRTSSTSCVPCGSWLKMYGTPPFWTVRLAEAAPTGMASSSAAVSTNEAMPPLSSDSRMARGTWRPAFLVSSEISPADSKP